MRRRTLLMGGVGLLLAGASGAAVRWGEHAPVAEDDDLAQYRADAALFVGDSIMDGQKWVRDLARDLKWMPVNADPFNRARAAIAGSTLLPVPGVPNDLVTAFDKRAGDWQARHVVAMVGTNDWGFAGVTMLTPAAYGAGWRDAMERFAAMPGRPDLTIVAIPPSDRLPYYTSRLPGWATTAREGIALLNAAAEPAVRERGGRWVDLADMSAALMNADGIHPTRDGERWIAGRIAATVRGR